MKEKKVKKKKQSVLVGQDVLIVIRPVLIECYFSLSEVSITRTEDY